MDADVSAARKQELRGELRATLRGVRDDPVRRAAGSAAITAQLSGLVADRLAAAARGSADAPAAADVMTPGGAPGVVNVMVFRALPSEPQLDAFVEWCGAAGLTVVAPRVVGAQMEPEDYVSGDDSDVPIAALDVVVVPGLAFTPDGRRLGRGGGHFDRFLPRLRPGCLTIGVCFTEQLRDDLPSEPHDVTVDRVISA